MAYERYGKPAAAKDAGLLKETPGQFPLVKRNFIWMAVAGALIVVGFLLMMGPSSTEEFNPDIFSTRRIVVGPSMAFIGFVAMGVAIILRPKQGAAAAEASAEEETPTA